MMLLPYSRTKLSMLSCVSGVPVSAHRYLLWHPGHLHGQFVMLMASVTSSGTSWNTMPVFSYFMRMIFVVHTYV